ncbi:MAG: ATP-binding cassette domain-containing protein [Candidatus Thermoplasmatota archaeon]|nr:ATP-binding cassette domain-containing protein [Candidatus Thermoplasmatota archaeon]
MDLLQVEGLTVIRGTSEVLSNYDLNIHSGECVILSGPNGCGKSTLIEAVAGLLPIHSGRITISKPFGLTLQGGGIHGDEIVHERMRIAANISGADSQDAVQLLDQWNLAHRSADRIGQLSDGMGQRISTIQGLLPAYAGDDARLCLLDEPSLGLDDISVETLISDINSLIENGHSFLIATHDSRLQKCATRTIEMGEKSSRKSAARKTDLANVKSAPVGKPFGRWASTLHMRTKTPFISLGLPLIAALIILAGIDSSRDQDGMMTGVVLLFAPFISAMVTPPILRYVKENRTGDWWRAHGDSFDPAIPAAVIIILSPWIVSHFSPFTIDLDNLKMLCLGLTMFTIYHANQALHLLADRLPRSAGQFVTLLTLILIWPFMMSAELVSDWNWTGFCISIGIPLIVAIAVPIVHPRTGSD